MSAVLAKCLQDIILKVEQVSGKKIKFVEKRGMSIPVVSKLARNDMPAHIFYLDSSHQDVAWHSIAHECVHIIRLFEVEENQRIVPMATPEMRMQAFEEIEEEFLEKSSSLTDELFRRMRDFWYDSIMRQLTNYPSDIMIERWLYKFYPELRPSQIQAIQQQAESATGALNQEVKELTPEIIYNASNIMNYTYFHFLGKLLELQLDQPFQDTQFAKEGKKLVKFTEDRYRDDYEGDVAMIHLWAEFLGLSNWFAWIDLENVPA
jgi:hypothetical protein